MEFSSWVTGHLTGGIGNRLFQHAAAAGLAEKWSRPLVFYIPECGPTNHGPFENIFKLFPTVPQLTHLANVQRLPEPHGGVFTYCEFPSTPVAPCVSVDGWRQTELYFPTNGLKPDFENALSSQRRSELQTLYKLTTSDEKLKTWFLHIRLGDYKILPHHQIDMISYYSQVRRHIPEGVRILLFSDELETFGVGLQTDLQKMGIDTIPVSIPNELEALYVMSQCWGGSVVANSTFSWWGAYFARISHPVPSSYKAIYPAVWGKGLPPATDIVPSWGLKIHNT